MLKKICNKLIWKTKVFINQKKITNRDFTVISQNCLGGVIYHDYGMNFYSPTINMFIEDENFLKLIENLEYYLSLEAEPYIEKFQDPFDSSISYPKIKVGDIELCCLHYKNCQEAIDAWERRKKRVNLNNVYVIGNTWNLHNNKELIERLCKFNKYKVLCFTNTDEFQFANCIRLKGDFWRVDERGIVRPNITDFIPKSIKRYYEEQFDFISWFNEK